MLKLTTVVAVVFSFIACEDDFETIGSSVVGEPGFNADLYDDAEIEAKTYLPGPVQTNNLPLNLLGIYQDPLFGTHKANILSSLVLTNPDPSFGEGPVLDSVVLSVPYFSREVATDDGSRFELDSIYGNAPIKLSVIESRFYLNNFDPDADFQKTQKYYSNMAPRIESNLTTNVLYENESFEPSADPSVDYTVGTDGERDTITVPPAMRLHLDTNFFQSKIIDKAGSTELLNQNNFRDYFRGIYFNVEQVNNSGNMMLLNMQAERAGITLYYRTMVVDENDEDDDDDREELIEVNRSYKLNFGSSVNTFEQDTPQFNDDENLFLKGGEGSMAVIDLFSGPDADGDGVSDELEHLRENEWLINEANLIFHVNRSYMNGLNEPERVYLYDLNNYVMLADYILDSQGQMNSMTSTSNEGHLAPLERDDNGDGVSYKVRMTRHIDNILNKDSTNVRLGLVVSQNVNLVTNSSVLPREDAEVNVVPSAAVITPEATVLHGPNAENEDKRLKLNIYYTEPKN